MADKGEAEEEDAPPAAPSSWGLVLTWVLATAAGETAGLVITTAMSVSISDALGVPETTTERVLLVGLMALAGVVEGVSVGSVQWAVARRKLPGLRPAPWIAGTAAGFLIGWVAGMLLSSYEEAVLAAGMAPLGAVHGLIVGLGAGGFQALALRRHVERPLWWMGASGLAWCVGMMPPVIAASLLPTEASDLEWVLVTAAGGAMSGAVAGLVSGLVLVRLTPSRQVAGSTQNPETATGRSRD